MCRYGEPSSLDQAGPSSHYKCWEAAGGRSHHLCTLPQGHTGEHQLPQLGRTRKRAPSISIDLGDTDARFDGATQRLLTAGAAEQRDGAALVQAAAAAAMTVPRPCLRDLQLWSTKLNNE